LSVTRLRNYHQLWDREDIKCCPIETTFRLVGKKFTILIIREMMRDKTRFNLFLNSIEGIHPKILSARLKEMEKSGLIRRKVCSTETPVRIGYFLTEKGSALKSILNQMAIFSMRHCAKEVFKDRKPRTLKRDLVSTLQ
jgi:DNA-binding HxlR family transcriptional regulator